MQSSKGTIDWGTDRLERMVRTRDLEDERGGFVLLNEFETPARVGDFGSGIGRRRIYFPDSEYIGFDREEVMVENARLHFPDRDIRLGDITQIDQQYPELVGYFDLIVTYSVVQYNYAEEQEAIYNSIHACLKPGGLYYWRENHVDTLSPNHVDGGLFEAVTDFGPLDDRVFRKL